MLKIKSIELLDSSKILCFFSTGEKKVIDLSKALDLSDKFARKIINPENFKHAQVGSFGEILWPGMAEIKDYDGTILNCDYDMSPEFVYLNSQNAD